MNSDHQREKYLKKEMNKDTLTYRENEIAKYLDICGKIQLELKFNAIE